MTKFSVVALALAVTAAAAGCASTAGTDVASSPSASPVLVAPYPSAYPPSTVYPYTDAPRIDNSDAAGLASVPGVFSATPSIVVVPNTP